MSRGEMIGDWSETGGFLRIVVYILALPLFAIGVAVCALTPTVPGTRLGAGIGAYALVNSVLVEIAYREASATDPDREA